MNVLSHLALPCGGGTGREGGGGCSNLCRSNSKSFSIQFEAMLLLNDVKLVKENYQKVYAQFFCENLNSKYPTIFMDFSNFSRSVFYQ